MAKKRKTIWVQHIDVEARSLKIRLSVARAGGLNPQQQAVAAGVQDLLERACSASARKVPFTSRALNWWRGDLVEAAYQNAHAARAQLVDLYDEADIHAEIPGAIARLNSTLDRHDPRGITEDQLDSLPLERRRAWLRRLVEDGYEAVDLKHVQLRSFRNILLMAAAIIILLVGLAMVVVSLHPSALPLCFAHQATNAGNNTVDQSLTCPTRSNTGNASGGDIWVVGLLGLLGGALAASMAIRNLQGTSTPYDVPVAVAWLKVPLGAFTAILGILAIRGGFLPGLSALDNQEQILAYALLLGFAQQLLTGVLDRKAQSLLTDVPSKAVQRDPHSPSVGLVRHVPVGPVPRQHPV
jgi:hypothetical protein